MAVGPTRSASTRNAFPNGSSSGPSCCSRTSRTDPTLSPSESTTSDRSRSLRCMATPGDLADHVIPHPTFRAGDRHVVAVDPELDVRVDLAHDVERDRVAMHLVVGCG